MNSELSIGPALRFPEFQSSLATRQLGEVTQWSSGGTPPKAKPSYWNGDIPWISASSMRGIEYSDSELKLTKEGVLNGSKLARKGSLLILVRGSMLFKSVPIGRAARDVAFNQDVKSIQCTPELLPDFLLYWLLASESILLSMVSGTSIGAGKLDYSELQSLHICLPETAEQAKIAAFLSTVDEKLEQLTRKKELLLKYKDGVMQEIFNQKIRFKEDNGNDFPDWEEKQIIEIAPLQRGFDLPVDKIVKGEFPVVFSNGILRTHSEAKAKAPGVVTGRSGTIGKVIYVEKDYWPHNTSLWVTDFKGNHPKFIFYFYLNLKLEKFGTGSGVPTLNRNDVHNQKVLIPTSPEQIKIADFISAIDEKINLVNQQLEKTNAFKKGLLQQMFV